jgi:TonB family protein
VVSIAAPKYAGSASSSTAKAGSFAAKPADTGRSSPDTANPIFDRIKNLPDSLLDPQTEETSPNALDAILGGEKTNLSMQDGSHRSGGNAIKVKLVVKISDSGRKTKTSIDASARNHLGEFHDAYLNEKAKKPNLSGNITLKFVLDSSGVVDSIGITRSTTGDSKFDQDILEHARRMSFEAVDHDRTVVLFRLSFR